ncbi:MAG: acetylhydrolase [Verrucomicrobiae bacterium]|nr:acetylhydrolase [Verrucomicrobiae bacterium]
MTFGSIPKMLNPVMRMRVLCIVLFLAGLCFGLERNSFAQENLPSLEWPKDESVIPGKGNLRNSDWFKGHYQKRREGFRQEADGQQKAVVFLGDSITEGWGDRLSKAFSDYKTANRGISGDVTRTVLYRLKEDVTSLNPTAVVLLIGTNDLDEGNSPEVISSNTIEILEQLKAFNPELPVIFCKIMPRSEFPDHRTSNIIIANKLTCDYIQKANNPQWIVLDTWSMFATDKGVVVKEELPDFLHLSSPSYDKWINGIKTILTSLKLNQE